MPTISLVSRPQAADCTSKLRNTAPSTGCTRLSVSRAARVRFPRTRTFRGVNVRCDAQEKPTISHNSTFVEEESALKEELRKATRFEKRLEARVGVPQELEVFTGDELHYVETSDGWRLALWRYLPSDSVPRKAHPVLLLSGIATNALGYDISEEVSLARHLAGQGFDTWVLELRGAGLSQSPFSIAGKQGFSTATSSAIGPIEGPPITFLNGFAYGRVNTAIDTEGPTVESSSKYASGSSLNGASNGTTSGNGSAVSSSSSREAGVTNGSVFTPLFSSDDEDATAAAATTSATAAAAATTVTAATTDGPAATNEDASEGFSVTSSLSRTMQLLRNYFDQFSITGLPTDPQTLRPKLKATESRLRAALDQSRSQQPVALLDFQHLLVELQTCSDVELTSSGLPRLRQALDSFFSIAQSPEISPEAVEALEELAGTVGPLDTKTDTSLPAAATAFLQQTTRLLSSSLASSNLDKRLADLQKRLGEIVESRQGVATPGVAELYEQLIRVILQTQDVASLAKEYNWDFDTYLYEDVPAAMRYVRERTQPHDGKILAVGHSHGGILLYSRMAALGPDAGLLGVVTGGVVAGILDGQLQSQATQTAVRPSKGAQLPRHPSGSAGTSSAAPNDPAALHAGVGGAPGVCKGRHGPWAVHEAHAE
ncbi:hypothetical protein CLOM_g9023 [Closterium sp. NIES-68]|nr:hypothetical protein CLOM_g9023 [Closterium sp. NIES-68]